MRGSRSSTPASGGTLAPSRLSRIPARRGRGDVHQASRPLVRRPWVQTLVVGLVLFAVLDWALLHTGNINLVPSVIVLGAFLGPVVFVEYVYDLAQGVSPPQLMGCFIAGGVLGVAAASVLEYRTLIDLRALPTLYIGLIEEACKLIVPLAILLFTRDPRPTNGVLFGVASGMGFAAFETMGYGLQALLASGGDIGEVEKLLFIRGVLSPAGHAAWTGLTCAMLWYAWARPAANRIAAAIGAFLLAATLHGLWDASTSISLQVVIGAISFALLSWCLRSASRGAAAEEAYALE
jgi:protease PrsW